MSIGLVLSGGGARGVAHIGAIKAITEHNIKITHVAGTSAGAVVGSLYAAGYSWQEILKFFESLPIFHYSRYALNKPGFFDSVKYINDFKKVFPEDTFESLEKKLYIPATNLIDGTLKVFSSGELIKPMLASACMPGVFTPIHIDNDIYVDGGILNNFPADLLKPICDKLVGVYVNPLEAIENKKLRYSYQIITRAYQIAIANQSHTKFELCDLLVLPNGLLKYGLFSLKNLNAIFEIGYKIAKKEIEKNEAVLKNTPLKFPIN